MPSTPAHTDTSHTPVRGNPIEVITALPAALAAQGGMHRVAALLDPQSDFARRLAMLDVIIPERYFSTIDALSGGPVVRGAPVTVVTLAERDEPEGGRHSRSAIASIADFVFARRGCLCVLPLSHPVDAIDLWRNAPAIFAVSRRIPLVFLCDTRVQSVLMAEALRLAGVPTLPSRPLLAVTSSQREPMGYLIEVNQRPESGASTLAAAPDRDRFECLVEHCSPTIFTHPDHRVGTRDEEGRVYLNGPFAIDLETGDLFEREPDPFAAMLSAPSHLCTRVGSSDPANLPAALSPEAPLLDRLYWAQALCAHLEFH